MWYDKITLGVKMGYKELIDFIVYCKRHGDYDENLEIQADGGRIVWNIPEFDGDSDNIQLIWKHSQDPIGLNYCVITQRFEITKLSPRDANGKRLDKSLAEAIGQKKQLEERIRELEKGLKA